MGPTRPQVLQVLHSSSGASPTAMFVYFVIVLVMASHCLAGPTNQMQVTVTEEDMKSGTMDRTVCCVTAQSQRATKCSGQACTATCNARCGIFGIFDCGTWTCSTIQTNCSSLKQRHSLTQSRTA